MKNKSVIVEWIICYMVILMIPVITIFVNYFYNVKVIKQEIYESNELVLNNLADRVNEIFKEERSFFEQIVSDNEFALLLGRAEKDKWFYYYIKEICSGMESYDKWCEMSGMIYIFDKDYVIGRAGYDSNIYYESLGRSLREEISYDRWLELITAEYTNSFWVERCLDGSLNEQCIIYADSLQWGIYGKANVFIHVPVSEIEQLTEELEPGTRFIISADNKQQLVVSSEGVEELLQNIKDMDEEEVSFDTEEYMVLRKHSSEKKVEYYMLVPQRNFWKEFRYVRNLFYTSLILTLFVGFFCVSLLLKKNYRPLSELYAKMTNGIGVGNEFQQIEKIYDMLIHDNDILHKQIDAREEAAQRCYLMSVMKGWTVWKQNDEVLLNLLPEEKLVLVGLRIPLLEGTDHAQDELLFFVVDNIFSELMEQEKFYRLEEGRYLFYLFRIQDDSKWKGQCLEKLRFLHAFLEEKWGGRTFIAAVGRVEGDVEQLAAQYLAVTEVLESANAIGIDGVIDTENGMQSGGIVKKIIEYTELHYAESNMNVNSIADGIGLSAKYISKVFKEETGKSILDYIHGLRIKKAQSLIQLGRYSLEEIYEQVGYANDVTFRRAFVKFTGVVPSEYKNSLKKSL